MFFKKYLLVILIFLSLICSISAVSAENDGLADYSINDQNMDFDAQSSVSIGVIDDSTLDASSSSSDDSSSADSNQGVGVAGSSADSNLGTGVTSNSTAAVKKTPRVWINKMSIKSKKTVIKLKSDKKGIIYYTTDGSKPTVKSKKFKNNITLSSKKVLKYFVLANDGTKSKIFTYKRILGKTSKGYVEKLYYGNLSSNQTIALIVGVHVQESGMHNAIYKSLKKKNAKLNRRFVLYFIHVTKDKNSYPKSRMNGQILGNKYIVKDISKEKPQIVTDIHIHMISNNKIKSVKISKKLHKKSSTYLKRLLKLAPHIKRFDPQLGSSPAFITVPIANKGIVSYIYETELSYSKNLKQKYADKYIKALNKVDLTF